MTALEPSNADLHASPESVQNYIKTLEEEAASHDPRILEAFGMFLNGLAYWETFPDDAEDAKSLQKQATYNFLRARNHLTDAQSAACSEACKRVYTEEYNAGR